MPTAAREPLREPLVGGSRRADCRAGRRVKATHWTAHSADADGVEPPALGVAVGGEKTPAEVLETLVGQVRVMMASSAPRTTQPPRSLHTAC